MARRGGFGDPNGGGKMQGQMLPFAVDPSLEDEAKKREETQSLFPPYPGGVPRAPPPTAREKRMVQYHIEDVAVMKESVFHDSGSDSSGNGWSDRSSDGALDERSGIPLKNANFDPFNDRKTWSNLLEHKSKKSRKKDPKLHKYAAPELMPKEFRELAGYKDPNGNQSAGPKRTLGLSKEDLKKKLDEFNEDADDEKDLGDEDDEDEGVKGKKDEDDEAQGPVDDDFDEDDDDGDNDYNAEQYFDDGDGDGDEGGEDYGDEAA